MLWIDGHKLSFVSHFIMLDRDFRWYLFKIMFTFCLHPKNLSKLQVGTIGTKSKLWRVLETLNSLKDCHMTHRNREKLREDGNQQIKTFGKDKSLWLDASRIGAAGRQREKTWRRSLLTFLSNFNFPNLNKMGKNMEKMTKTWGSLGVNYSKRIRANEESCESERKVMM